MHVLRHFQRKYSTRKKRYEKLRDAKANKIKNENYPHSTLYSEDISIIPN